MKKCRLLKDFLTVKAGAIFNMDKSGDLQYRDAEVTCGRLMNIPEAMQDKMKEDGIFDEWFEEIEESKVWKPKEGGMYYYIWSDETILSSDYYDNYYGNSTSKKRLKIGNCFETREDAERAVEKLKALRRLREKGLKFYGWDWERSGDNVLIVKARCDYDSKIGPQIAADLNQLFDEEEE